MKPKLVDYSEEIKEVDRTFKPICPIKSKYVKPENVRIKPKTRSYDKY
jgi:hypothetical protein